jgi:hypothetical protein
MDMHLFAIDSGDFLNNPLSSGLKIVKQISSFLHVFEFHEPSGRQTDPNLLARHFLGNRRP